eukprot:6478919-Pyramimonas_sp.AAC.1
MNSTSTNARSSVRTWSGACPPAGNAWGAARGALRAQRGGWGPAPTQEVRTELMFLGSRRFFVCP